MDRTRHTKGKTFLIIATNVPQVYLVPNFEEKEALYRLERSVESDKYHQETKHFIDSLQVEIEKQLK